MKIFTDWNDVITCRNFTDVDHDVSGVDLTRDGNHLGSMYGESIPDENDEEAMEDFKETVEVWMIDNEY